MTTKELIRRILLFEQTPQRSIVAPGLYQYFREAEATYTRFHLRVDQDGFGMLLANATAAARLSPTGVIIAKGLLEEDSEAEIYKRLSKNFSGATQAKMRRDLELVAGIIANLAAPGDNYPIINLEDADLSPYEAELIAPLRADIPHTELELTKDIIDRLWTAAIPHITVHVLDNLQIDDLVYSIEHAEDIGLIAGVRSRAHQLVDSSLVKKLAQAGVDYLTVPVASSDPLTHDLLVGNDDASSIESVYMEIKANEVAPAAEIPLVNSTLEDLQLTLDYLMTLGVYNIQFFAVAAPDEMNKQDAAGALYSSAMPQVAELVEELASEMDVRFIWGPPILRLPELTLSEQVQRGPRCSDDFSVRIDSTGGVIPARGPYKSAGNLLDQDWSEIWNHPSFLNYRERVERPTRCDDCPDLAICAADCPRRVKGWSQGYGEWK
jgi:radical SAM protein with 4Fe4S-binding SPASM domain